MSLFYILIGFVFSATIKSCGITWSMWQSWVLASLIVSSVVITAISMKEGAE